jgi:hypothetical protein
VRCSTHELRGCSLFISLGTQATAWQNYERYAFMVTQCSGAATYAQLFTILYAVGPALHAPPPEEGGGALDFDLLENKEKIAPDEGGRSCYQHLIETRFWKWLQEEQYRTYWTDNLTNRELHSKASQNLLYFLAAPILTSIPTFFAYVWAYIIAAGFGLLLIGCGLVLVLECGHHMKKETMNAFWNALLLLLHALFSVWCCTTITTCSILLYDHAAQEWPISSHHYILRCLYLGMTCGSPAITSSASSGS